MKNQTKASSHGPLEDAIGKMGNKAPKLRISANMYAEDGLYPDDSKWRQDEIKRLDKEIKAMEEQISNWDDKKVATEAKKSFQRELASKKARRMENEAMLGDD